MKFSLKANSIEAVQWIGSNLDEVASLLRDLNWGVLGPYDTESRPWLRIDDMDRVYKRCEIGDWVAVDKDKVYVFTHGILHAKFEVLK